MRDSDIDHLRLGPGPDNYGSMTPEKLREAGRKLADLIRAETRRVVGDLGKSSGPRDQDDKLKYERVQARVRLAMLVADPTVRMLLEVAVLADAAPTLLADIETVLQDLTDRDRRNGGS